jgi:hypothetical protein
VTYVVDGDHAVPVVGKRARVRRERVPPELVPRPRTRVRKRSVELAERPRERPVERVPDAADPDRVVAARVERADARLVVAVRRDERVPLFDLRIEECGRLRGADPRGTFERRWRADTGQEPADVARERRRLVRRGCPGEESPRLRLEVDDAVAELLVAGVATREPTAARPLAFEDRP